jgi:protein-tyrosine phosphatase
MAEGMLAVALPGRQVSSAGTGALSGYPADPMARELMQEKGIDIDAHRARQLNLTLCQRADLILVMDRDQRVLVQQRYPFTSGKVFRMAEHSGHDVPDPYRRDRAAFEASLALIEEGARQWAQRISKISS